MATRARAVDPAAAATSVSARPKPLEAKALPLAPNRFPEVPELGFDDVIDGIACPTDIVHHVPANLVPWNPIPEVLAAVRRPPCASGRASSRPPRSPAYAAEHGGQRSRARRPR